VQGELPTIDTGGEIPSPNVPSGTGGTKSKSKYKMLTIQWQAARRKSFHQAGRL